MNLHYKTLMRVEFKHPLPRARLRHGGAVLKYLELSTNDVSNFRLYEHFWEGPHSGGSSWYGPNLTKFVDEVVKLIKKHKDEYKSIVVYDWSNGLVSVSSIKKFREYGARVSVGGDSFPSSNPFNRVKGLWNF